MSNSTALYVCLICLNVCLICMPYMQSIKQHRRASAPHRHAVGSLGDLHCLAHEHSHLGCLRRIGGVGGRGCVCVCLCARAHAHAYAPKDAWDVGLSTVTQRESGAGRSGDPTGEEEEEED